ncbi:hypothetical protein [Hydrogenophaga sp. BPS33]|uniref:hypothetical protein n=1 Tax=Hydrogenophaga sp. BPS33 TaxID=2651974 RepID=UPI0013204516|nr:hypothetical protein [Hydrogenophaga sp. BPS33]QHE85107.1 hypothetical protein F9K07_09525 [Hydrogenophaga sp. BPS33]
MVSAPSVTYPVGRCRFYAGLLVALGLLGALVLGRWFLGVGSHRGWQGGLGAAAGLLWWAFAAWGWWHSPVGALRWDVAAPSQELSRSGAWVWRGSAAADSVPLPRVVVSLDMQNRILLCLHSAGTFTRWVWVERRRDPARWPDLRRALVAHT